MNCRINKRREWQARLLLEASTHDHAIFVTLTLADVGTPSVLSKAHLRPFFRSLRQIVPSLRHFSVGEYGSKTGRAHYHAHLFSNTPILDDHIRSCWPYGRVHVGDTEPASLDYVLGYLLKDRKAIRWPIEQRFPEFRSYSKGMGKLAFPHLLIDPGNDPLLPREFKVFNRKWPIGRYFREKAKALGYEVVATETAKVEQIEAKAMRSLLLDPKTPEQVEAAYKKFWEDRKAKSTALRNRAIRAAYLEQHGHVKKGNTNETF